jgi:hypothetical protein
MSPNTGTRNGSTLTAGLTDKGLPTIAGDSDTQHGEGEADHDWLARKADREERVQEGGERPGSHRGEVPRSGSS